MNGEYNAWRLIMHDGVVHGVMNRVMKRVMNRVLNEGASCTLLKVDSELDTLHRSGTRNPNSPLTHLQFRESLRVDERVSCGVVVRVVALAVPAALLPVVVQTNVAVAEVAERCGHAVDSALAGDHAEHDGLHELLVDVGAVQVPRSPTHRRRQTQTIVQRQAQRRDHRKHVYL